MANTAPSFGAAGHPNGQRTFHIGAAQAFCRLPGLNC
jgi:hypothetical protein